MHWQATKLLNLGFKLKPAAGRKWATYTRERAKLLLVSIILIQYNQKNYYNCAYRHLDYMGSENTVPLPIHLPLQLAPLAEMLKAAKSAGFTGFGLGSTIMHVDLGPRRYWGYTSSGKATSIQTGHAGAKPFAGKPLSHWAQKYSLGG